MADRKQKRATCKSLFTRARNLMVNSIHKGDNLHLVESKYSQLQRRYNAVQEAHAEYVILLEKEGADVTKEEEWIQLVETEFEDAEIEYFELVKSECPKKEDSSGNDPAQKTKSDENAITKMKNIRELERISFYQILENISNTIQNTDINPEVIKIAVIELKVNLKEQLNRCKQIQVEFVSLLSHDDAIGEMHWLDKLQLSDTEINLQIAEFISIHQDDKVCRTTGLRLERMKMPEFSGSIRDYPRFKKDFERRVAPEINSEDALAYALKSCLRNIPLDLVKNVDDNIREMWSKLDEKYGRSSKLVDAVLYDIKQVPVILEDNDEMFLEFVDKVECGFRDLERLNLQHEMCNTNTISLLEGKLPPSTKKQWSRVVNKTGSEVDDRDKFPSLLKFLLEEKRAIEYNSSELRSENASGAANYIDENARRGGDTPLKKCLIHKSNNHVTEECTKYTEMSPEEKIGLLKENRACWSCLKVGHRITRCYKTQECGENGCQMNHHKSLHECHAQGITFHATKCSLNQTNRPCDCLLQLMRIPTNNNGRSGSVNVLFDGGATISLITFSKVKSLGLNGTPIKLTVVKVGGTTEEIQSQKYDLDLTDKSGKRIRVQVYGIDKISTNIRSVKLNGILALFSGVKEKDIQRPRGEIDVLMGLEYAGYHPVRQQANGHLLLLENQFGICIGGSHPTLRVSARKIIQRVNVVKYVTEEAVDVTDGIVKKIFPDCVAKERIDVADSITEETVDIADGVAEKGVDVASSAAEGIAYINTSAAEETTGVADNFDGKTVGLVDIVAEETADVLVLVE